MAEKVTISLRTPIRGPNDLIVKEIVVREPTFDEYSEIGDPFVVATTPGGSPFLVENVETIRRYIQLCVVEPQDPALLSQLGARYAKQVKEKILGFFPPDAA